MSNNIACLCHLQTKCGSTLSVICLILWSAIWLSDCHFILKLWFSCLSNFYFQHSSSAWQIDVLFDIKIRGTYLYWNWTHTWWHVKCFSLNRLTSASWEWISVKWICLHESIVMTSRRRTSRLSCHTVLF